jgi:hypothetical protein
MNSLTRCYRPRRVEPSCKIEAVGDSRPGGAFYRVAEGGRQAGGEGEWWPAAVEILNVPVSIGGEADGTVLVSAQREETTQGGSWLHCSEKDEWRKHAGWWRGVTRPKTTLARGRE